MLSLHDTYRGRRAPLRPRGRRVTLYVCGVTPYDTTHLGHARTFLVFDVLVRHLESKGLAVRYAQNVTDVDESILQRAKEVGLDWRELGGREESLFLEDMDRLGWRRPDVMPHATNELAGMLKLAKRLIDRGHAYALPGDGMYFDVSTFPRFGRLSRLSRAKMRQLLAQQDDTRLDDPRKRDALDFALWRRPVAPPVWPSPFGDGRPGWHLECSAMAIRHLGQPVDIHGGGDDLTFPHHECEIAQSEAASGKRFVRFWMHVGAMLLDGEKMSKSKGNMVFVRDTLRDTHPDGVRLYLLSRHYRKRFEHDARLLTEFDDLAAVVREGGRGHRRAPVPREALRALDDDLDTPKAITLLARYARAGDAERAVPLARHLGLTLRD